jgi:hypothetical protein
MGVTDEYGRTRGTSGVLQVLLNRLGTDSEAAGKEYERLRRGLSNYFRVKGLFRSLELADVTLDRVASLLSAKEVIDVEGFCFGVARLICMEQYRAENRQRTADEKFTNSAGADHEEEKYELMRKCLETLAAQDQALLREYYSDLSPRARTANREKLARQAGMSIVHLRLRIHRLRRKLESCLHGSRD